MTRTRLIFALVLVVTGLVLAGCGGSDDDESAGTTAAPADTGTGGGNTLTGTVGPGFDISMTGTDGLTPGEYTITVSDKSSAHNFHLTGPGVDMKTEVVGGGGHVVDGQSAGRRIQVRLRPACEPDERLVYGQRVVSAKRTEFLAAS